LSLCSGEEEDHIHAKVYEVNKRPFICCGYDEAFSFFFSQSFTRFLLQFISDWLLTHLAWFSFFQSHQYFTPTILFAD